MRRRRDLWIAASALAVAVVAAAVFLVLGLSQGTSRTPLAAGEAIYRTGAFEGKPIPRTGTSGGMMGGSGMGGGMMAAGCASCHGLDGRGRVTQTFTAPDITYANLTDPAGMLQPDGSRGPTYTDATLRKAVTQGIDPEGSKLAQPMPQWQLTDQEWTALLAYLKTLH
jgi:mono/diheme cytochrome c family protein